VPELLQDVREDARQIGGLFDIERPAVIVAISVKNSGFAW
jgi:hypothetical protein